MTILVDALSNTPIHDGTNTPVYPTYGFEIIVSDITEPILFLNAPISYEPEIMFIQLEDLNQELIDTATTFKISITQPKISLLISINSPLKIPTVHLQDHQTHYSMALNLNSALKFEDNIKTRRFQKPKNHLDFSVPPPTPGGSRTTHLFPYLRQVEHGLNEFYHNCCLLSKSDIKAG